MLATSATLTSLIRIGLGREAPEENFPSLKQSLIDWDGIEPSRDERTLTTLVRSDLKQADLDIPEGHSCAPYRTALNLLYIMMIYIRYRI